MKKRIFDTLIGVMLGIIISFVTVMIIDGRTISETTINESNSSYGDRISDDEAGRAMEQTEESEQSSGVAEPASVSGNSGEETINTEEDYEYESITEYFKQCDPDWNESGAYQEAVKAYENYIGKDTVDEINWSGQPRFEIAYIDEDDIPELLFCLSNHTPDGVFIFKYIPDRKEVISIGEFSQFGGIDYVEHGNRISSQYGNQGVYIRMVSKLDSDRAVAIGSVAIDGSGRNTEEIKDGEVWMTDSEELYYAGYKLPKGADGSHKDFYSSSYGTGPDAVQIDFPDDKYRVSEEEYDKTYFELLGLSDNSNSISHVKYDGMKGEANTMHTVRLREGGRSYWQWMKDEIASGDGELILDRAFPDRINSEAAMERIVEIYSNRNSYVDYTYCMRKLNDDNEYDLLVIRNDNYLSGVSIYTYYDGEAVFLGEFGENCQTEIDVDKHIVHSVNTSGGQTRERYYKIGLDKAEIIDEFISIDKSSFGKEGFEYTVNGETVTKEQFDEAKSYHDATYEVISPESERYN